MSSGHDPIDFYFDFISPFGYFASRFIDDLAAQYDREVRWIPFRIGITITKVMGYPPLLETPLKAPYTVQDVARLAKLLRTPIRLPEGPRNSIPAMCAYHLVARDDAAVARRFARAVFDAHWREGRPIADGTDLDSIAAAAGVDRDLVRSAATSDVGRSLLRDATQQAISRGVFGSPTIDVDGNLVFGVDRLWMVRHWLEHGSWDDGPPLDPTHCGRATRTAAHPPNEA